MPRTSSENSNLNFRIDKTNRLVVFNYSSSTSNTNKFLSPITTTNSNIKNDFKQKLQGRTEVVDAKFENLQSPLLDSVSQSSADTNTRCI